MTVQDIIDSSTEQQLGQLIKGTFLFSTDDIKNNINDIFPSISIYSFAEYASWYNNNLIAVTELHDDEPALNILYFVGDMLLYEIVGGRINSFLSLNLRYAHTRDFYRLR